MAAEHTASPSPYPSYRGLLPAELADRARRGVALLEHCKTCPRSCRVNRLEDDRGTCKTGRLAVVSSCFPHFGEEDGLRGRKGSGTIFFSHCNLKCVFCQNFDISQTPEPQGPGSTPSEIAAMMLRLQLAGCHNINFVTPEHVVPQLLEAVAEAIELGLRLPLVYNTSAYDSLESLELLEGIVDIYMPDFKYWSKWSSKTYLRAGDYPDVARAAIKAMHQQVGPLEFDSQGLARRGVLIRHLVMPGALGETRSILKWIAKELGPGSYVNLMDQYHPSGKVNRKNYPELNRRITSEEFLKAQAIAKKLGLRLDTRTVPDNPALD